MFSDGVTEAMNTNEEMFEEERLLQVLGEAPDKEASAVMNWIIKKVDDFTTGCEQADDISVVVVSHHNIGCE